MIFASVDYLLKNSGKKMKKILLLFIIVFPAILFAQPAIPELWGVRIHDEAKILSSQFVNDLEAQLKAHEDSTSNQIAVLIIPSLEGEPIEDYSIRVAEKWKLGQQQKDNGVLLLIAVDDHKIRIETGEGIEGVLPDVVCNQIIRNEMAPYFRQGNYEAGIQAGIQAILSAIAGEYQADTSTQKQGKRGGSILPFLIILIVIIIISRIRGGGRGGHGRGWSSGSGWFPMGGFSSGRGGGGGFGGFSGGGGGFGGGGSSGSW